MGEPQIISSYDGGKHNKDVRATVQRLSKSGQHKDLSTIIVIPTYKNVAVKVVASWLNLMSPPNNRLVRMFAYGMEVGEAYSNLVSAVLDNPDLSAWKYMLFMEHDNVPPCDGLIRLLERAEDHPEFSAIGGLYFTKGHNGVAQIWGDPNSHPFNFRPQMPDANGGLVESNGTGMGFTLFRMSMFKDKRLRRPWFKTAASKEEGMYTQDLYFWTDAKKWGHRCAIDCSVRVGHYEEAQDITW